MTARWLFAGSAMLAVALPGVAAATPKKRRVETAVHSQASDAKRVKESYVHLYAPLPSEDGRQFRGIA